jgi:hypothetical protein
MKTLWMTTLLALLVVLGGCAANHARAQRDQAHLQAVEAAAGKPVGAFSYVTNTLYSWEPLSRSELLIYTRPNQAWLLNVGLCQELPYTTAIGLTSHVGQVSTLRDSVIVQRALHPCTIQKIQPVDVSQLKHHMSTRGGAKIMPEAGAKG